MRFRRSAFTLVELMIVVAIIGILAAIALPNMAAMQLRAKRSEIAPNVKAISVAEFAYEATNDQFLAQDTPMPRDDSALDKQPVAWATGSNFDLLGWRPSGLVRANYAVATYDSAGTSPTSLQFVITGKGDIDGDGVDSVYTATNLKEVTMMTSNDQF